MANIDLLIPIILKWEGGYVNHPSDKGGATNMGITLGTFMYYRIMKGLPKPTVEDLQNITVEEWKDILKTQYWNRWQADYIKNQHIANLLVDWHWGSGVYGIQYPQQVLQVTADGVAGKVTLAAVNNYPNPEELFQKLWNRRKQHFEDIVKKDPSQKVFLKGWLNRLNDFKFEK